MARVERTRYVRGSAGDLTTLEQRFRFTGDGASSAAIARVLLTAPLTGVNSIFGDRPGEESERTDVKRTLRAFSPAPGFRFDVDLVRVNQGAFRVRFSQPDRDVPYLHGTLVWTVEDEDDGAILLEEINTERALMVADEPVRGSRRSLRRWLFFRAGHKQVMSRATSNIAALLGQAA